MTMSLRSRLAGLALLPFVLSACFDPGASSTSGSTSASSADGPSTISFPGAIEARNIVTGVSVRWAPTSGASAFRVYRVSGTTKTLLATLGASAESFIDGGAVWGQIYSYMVRLVDSQGKEDGNTQVVSALAWGGIASVEATSRTEVTVTFATITAVADEVRVYLQNDLGQSQLVGTVTGNDLSFVIDSLKIGKTYTIRAQAYVASLQKEDGNTLNFPVTTKTEGYHDDGSSQIGYRNVMNIRAFGDSSGAPLSVTNVDRTPRVRQVEVMWPAFYGKSDPSTEYVLVRAKEGQTIDTSATRDCDSSYDGSCRVCRIAGSGMLYCKDTKVAPSPARYQYVIALIQKSGTDEWVEPLPTENPDRFKLTVPMPPSNMVLVQRDAVNHEICLTMGRTSDPVNHNRCVYTGIGAVPYSTGHNRPALNMTTGYYDFGYNLFVDRFEVGCNWTRGSTAMCGAGSTAGNPQQGDCIDYLLNSDTPNPNKGLEGQVLAVIQYNTGGSSCMIKKGGTWVPAFNIGNGYTFTTAEVAAMTTNDPSPGHIPPVVQVFQKQAGLLCSARVDANYGAARLPRLREKTAYLAWPTETGDPYLVSSPSSWEATHGSTNIYGCNGGWIGGTSAGQSTPPTNAAEMFASTNFILRSNTSGTTATNFNSPIFTGSTITADCQSRYGVQDGIGNVQEYMSDIFASYVNTAAQPYTRIGGASPFDSGNTDLAGVLMDGNFGVGGGSWSVTSGTSSIVIGTSTYVNTVAVPLGLPLATTSSVYTPKGSIALNSDTWNYGTTITNNTPYARVFIGGGRYDQGGPSGRWNLALNWVPNDQDGGSGFRCVIPAE